MPVSFYPYRPIDLLEQYIVKEDGSPLHGEIDIYRKLFADLEKSDQEWHIWHDLHLPFHAQGLNPYHKTGAQIDFLILCQEGIMVLEVKGGPISLKDNTFYYGNHYEQPIWQDPFTQAEGYKYTIKDHILNTGSHYLICHAVAFPHCYLTFNARVIEAEVLWTQGIAPQHDHSMETFLLSVFRYNRDKHARYRRHFPRLDPQEVQEVKRILSPIARDVNRYYNPNTSEWLNVNNLDILDSLTRNDRIMIEGCPGTGKTTLAKAFIDGQLTKRGLYLCWNNLLMHQVRHELGLRGILETCTVTTFSRFLLQLDPSLAPQQLLELDEAGFYELLKKIIHDLKVQGQLPQYDYLVLDEGQDILDRGADILINELLDKNGNGLNQGKALLLYDIDQSYALERREVKEIADLISVYFAHFRLHEIRRCAQCPDIKEIAVKAVKDPGSLSSQLFSDACYERIKVSYFNSLEGIKDHLVQHILRSIRDKYSSLKGSNCILLIEAALLRPSYQGEPGMSFYLELPDVEELTEHNIADQSNKLRYTSILKYKGLEKDNVILIISDPGYQNKYELYIGITRAISHLEILIINK
jgi:hypothetical protein